MRAGKRSYWRCLLRWQVAVAGACLAGTSSNLVPSASADINVSATPMELAQALSADPSTVVGASYVAVPPNNAPNAVSTSPISGFPTVGSHYTILTSGSAALAGNPPGTSPGGFDDGGGNVRGNSDYDVTILKVDVNVPAGDNCLLGFDFKFLSEEYPTYVGTQYNDAFIAELDHSTWTTSGSQISAPNNFAFDPKGNPITINASGPASMSAANAVGTPYGGATPILTASTPITPGPHSIYFSIFDQGDHVLDSAVFIDNLSFGSVADPATQCVPGAKQAGSWTPVGPNLVTDRARGSSYADSGRVTAVAPDPTSSLVYVGTVGGGVWKVDTQNQTWTPLSDQAPSLAIGALALAHLSDASTVLIAGTGEPGGLQDPLSYGVGIMRGVQAADGSFSWSLAQPLEGARVAQIAVSPLDPSKMLAATSQGLYASTDAGVTWSRLHSGDFTAVVPDPSTAGSFLAGQGTGTDRAPCSATIWQGNFLSRWPSSPSYQQTAGSGLFSAQVALAASSSQAFALVSDCSGGFAASQAFVPSGPSGAYHWQAFATPAFVNGNSPAHGENSVIATVPGAACDVIVGGGSSGVARVTTSPNAHGGCGPCLPKFPCADSLGTAGPGGVIHEDQRALAFRNATLFVGNDGGLWSTASLISPSWTSWHQFLTARQSISTFYTGEAIDATHLIGGVQDEGTLSTVSSGDTANWSQVGGGDGGFSYATSGATRYFEQDMALFEPGNDNFVGPCTPAVGQFPYTCSGQAMQIPDPPLLMDTLEGSPNKVLYATNRVDLSTVSPGPNQGSWTNSSATASPPLTADAGYISRLGFKCGTGCPDSIAAAAVDWKAFGGPKIFTASAFGAVRMATSTPIGQNWEDIGTGLPQPAPSLKIPNLPWISGVAIDPCVWSSSNNCGNNHEAWVSIEGNGLGAVYHTDDYTQSPVSWSSVGTFNTPITSLAVVSTPNGDNNHVDLYVGTANERVLTCGGCYGDKPSSDWSQVGTGLPNAWVSDVSCSTDGRNLVAWTYGRGVWEQALSTNATGCVSKQQSDSFK